MMGVKMARMKAAALSRPGDEDRVESVKVCKTRRPPMPQVRGDERALAMSSCE
jgi:hypothetical protein